MEYGTRVFFDPIRELDFSEISSTYSSIGPSLNENIRMIGFYNRTNQDLYISTDGITPHLRLPVNKFKLFDLSANKIRDDGLFLSSGTQFYVKEVSASVSSGTFWMEAMYGEEGP